jgi:hypothetical protein
MGKSLNNDKEYSLHIPIPGYLLTLLEQALAVSGCATKAEFTRRALRQHSMDILREHSEITKNGESK